MKLKEMAAQSRRDGYMAIDLSSGTMTLERLVAFVQDIFPQHELAQITLSIEDEVFLGVTAEPAVPTGPN